MYFKIHDDDNDEKVKDSHSITNIRSQMQMHSVSSKKNGSNLEQSITSYAPR